MTEDDFAIIEQSLGVSVPSAYRRVMAAYPFSDHRPSDAYIPDNVQYVCNLNRQIVTDHVFPGSWRPGLLAIGTSWGGDAHALDTSVNNSPVYKLSQDDDTISMHAPTLDDWVGKLALWYVHFDRLAAAAEYKPIFSAIRNAGFFATSPEPMDGWHRIVVSSRSRGGNSFWATVIRNQWFVGAWSGRIYRISRNVSGFCVAWLTESPDKTLPDFSVSIQEKYNLNSISDAQFNAVVTAS